jgi:hypothetical protein
MHAKVPASGFRIPVQRAIVTWTPGRPKDTVSEPPEKNPAKKAGNTTRSQGASSRKLQPLEPLVSTKFYKYWTITIQNTGFWDPAH